MQNHTTHKRCTKCGEFKPATTEYFYRLARSKDGLHTRCQICCRTYHAKYRAAHKEEMAEYNRQYRIQNRERIAQMNREWRENNRDHLREWQRKWRANNPEKRRAEYQRYRRKYPDKIRERSRKYYAQNSEKIIRRAQEWAEENREKRRESMRKWRRRNPDKAREATRRWNAANPGREKATKARRYARKKELPDAFTAEDWKFALDYFDGCCAVCDRPMNGLFHSAHADHWIPLTHEDCPGTIPDNIVPLCGGLDGCNTIKQNKLPHDWLVEKFGKRKADRILERIEAYFEIVQIE